MRVEQRGFTFKDVSIVARIVALLYKYSTFCLLAYVSALFHLFLAIVAEQLTCPLPFVTFCSAICAQVRF